jgi:hypothetical protein
LPMRRVAGPQSRTHMQKSQMPAFINVGRLQRIGEDYNEFRKERIGVDFPSVGDGIPVSFALALRTGAEIRFIPNSL